MSRLDALDTDLESTAYLIDLKGWFPRVPNPNQTASRNAHRVSHEDDLWRKRALELEDENESLKLRVQKQELGKHGSDDRSSF